MKDQKKKPVPQLFQKGQSGNPKGRPKGVVNLKTLERKRKIDDVLEAMDVNIEKMIKKLSPEKYAMLWVKLIEYRYPKLKATEITKTLTKNNLTITQIIVDKNSIDNTPKPKEITDGK